MFDERRQTTVKGIDRSYPLEPLENKPRKQANGNGVQKNGNLTVSRQSVTVKRVARADVNSNLNGGKPVVSYHEEIARETFGPSARQHQDDDEFGIENHVAQYSNGNHRDEVTRHFRSEEIFIIENMPHSLSIRFSTRMRQDMWIEYCEISRNIYKSFAIKMISLVFLIWIV